MTEREQALRAMHLRIHVMSAGRTRCDVCFLTDELDDVRAELEIARGEALQPEELSTP